MRIDKNSYGSLALVYFFSALAIAVMFLLCHSLIANLIVTAFVLFFAGWQTFFFRVPRRYSAGSDRLVSAVADGKVVIIDKVYEPEFLKRECIQISTYMDFWDVHANFWPVSGEVTYFKYHPGKHFLAFRPKASLDNEHTCIAIKTEAGHEVFFKQIAGTFARRIVNYAKPGLKVTAGDQCGIIKFGSRVDLLVPLDSKIVATLKQKPSACETILAELQ